MEIDKVLFWPGMEDRLLLLPNQRTHAAGGD